MRVEKLLKRLKREFIKVNLLQAALDSLIFFLAANLFLYLFSIELTPSFENHVFLTFLTFIFLVGDLVHRARSYNLEIYEQENPELDEILRTARDNLDRQNIVSQALFDELLSRARTVTSDSIIPSKKIIQKILAVGILSFLTVLSGIVGFQVQENGGSLLPSFDRVEDLIDEDGEEGFQLRNTSEIFDDSEDIDATDLEMDFNITGSGETGNSDFSSGEAGDLTLDVTGEDMTEDMDLAREYSLAIRNMEQ